MTNAERRDRIIAILTRRDGEGCFYCGATFEVEGPNRLTLDHMQPRSLGGPMHHSNLVLACATCNEKRGTTPMTEFLSSGYLEVRRSANKDAQAGHHRGDGFVDSEPDGLRRTPKRRRSGDRTDPRSGDAEGRSRGVDADGGRGRGGAAAAG